MATTSFCGGSAESSLLNRKMSEETDANARLIAAAPEMLEALESVEQACKGGDWTEAIEKAKVAIRKAKGE